MSYDHKEKLIDLVKSYPVLWKIRRKSRGLKLKYWEHVGVELGTTGCDARRQWEILRDQLRREAKRVKQNPNYQPTWVLYSKMLFSLQHDHDDQNQSLSTACSDDGEQYHSSDHFTSNTEEKSIIKVRKDLRESNDSRSIDVYPPSPPTPPTTTTSTTVLSSGGQQAVATLVGSKGPSTSAHGVTSSTQLKQRCRPPPRLYKLDLDIPETQEKQSRYSICEEDDEDYYFAMSLVPSLRCIPRSKKLRVRSQMMELVASAMDEGIEDDNYVVTDVKEEPVAVEPEGDVSIEEKFVP